ncbi:MAG: glycoside hydrolase family 88 protein [Bacteroidaceae bacterium]|nr:glycoside hydrolase family 88 protein [Bacteroidaceae bacterium]MBR3716802.1 glycoside hydrolase family 88 protein [Bacteroidaceae bacterium]
MKKWLIMSVGLLLCLASCQQGEKRAISDEQLAEVFTLAKYQYVMLDQQLTDSTMPRTVQADGSLRTSDLNWWCSGFFPGALWYIYEFGHSQNISYMAMKQTQKLLPLLDMNTDHDIGFQLNCSFGNAYKLTGNDLCREVLVEGARKLAARMNPTTGVIRSWDFLRKGWKYPVIIDNMMNLELLMVGAQLSGDVELGLVARTHADTTMKNHFRPDYTSYHLVNYDPETGEVLSRETVQGYADESAWSRGQAWALYGYSMMYRETRDERYLAQARGVADMLLKRLPEDGIPAWDLDDPSADALRDVSAAAIMASAFIELSEHTGEAAYMHMAERQLLTMMTPEYLAKPGENGGFLLKHGVGNLPEKSEVDVPLSYADYYFLEALVRYWKHEV